MGATDKEWYSQQHNITAVESLQWTNSITVLALGPWFSYRAHVDAIRSSAASTSASCYVSFMPLGRD